MTMFNVHVTPVMIRNLSKDDILYAYKCAALQASRSKAMRLQVGAIILHPVTRSIISSGYNGTEPGKSNVCEVSGVTKPSVIHAEANALAKLPFFFRFFKFFVLTHSPCSACASLIAFYRPLGIFYKHLYRDPSPLDFLRSSGIRIYTFS
jgi:deoxycytidylate deaminase